MNNRFNVIWNTYCEPLEEGKEVVEDRDKAEAILKEFSCVVGEAAALEDLTSNIVSGLMDEVEITDKESLSAAIEACGAAPIFEDYEEKINKLENLAEDIVLAILSEE